MKAILEEYGLFIVEFIAAVVIFGLLYFLVSEIGLGNIAKLIMNKLLGGGA